MDSQLASTPSAPGKTDVTGLNAVLVATVPSRTWGKVSQSEGEDDGFSRRPPPLYHGFAKRSLAIRFRV